MTQRGSGTTWSLPAHPHSSSPVLCNTSTWASSQASRRTDLTLLTWGMFRWTPEQLRQINTPRV